MALQPNIGPKTRIFYVILGAGVVVWSVLSGGGTSTRLLIGILGAATILSGAVGF